jgi:hypothetical protein
MGSTKKLTTEKFIKKSKEKHNTKYDYSIVDYKNVRTKVKIICLTHGIFEQNPTNHMEGQGCPKCKIEKSCLSNDVFINRSNKIHYNKYDYSMVEYKNARTKVKIICPIHGIFEQQPFDHLNGCGCMLCRDDNNRNTLDNFITRSNKGGGSRLSKM